jgi:DNA-directed RNA polymerase specialized sigma24 family protein
MSDVRARNSNTFDIIWKETDSDFYQKCICALRKFFFKKINGLDVSEVDDLANTVMMQAIRAGGNKPSLPLVWHIARKRLADTYEERKKEQKRKRLLSDIFSLSGKLRTFQHDDDGNDDRGNISICFLPGCSEHSYIAAQGPEKLVIAKDTREKVSKGFTPSLAEVFSLVVDKGILKARDIARAQGISSMAARQRLRRIRQHVESTGHCAVSVNNKKDVKKKRMKRLVNC